MLWPGCLSLLTQLFVYAAAGGAGRNRRRGRSRGTPKSTMRKPATIRTVSYCTLIMLCLPLIFGMHMPEQALQNAQSSPTQCSPRYLTRHPIRFYEPPGRLRRHVLTEPCKSSLLGHCPIICQSKHTMQRTQGTCFYPDGCYVCSTSASQNSKLHSGTASITCGSPKMTCHMYSNTRPER